MYIYIDENSLKDEQLESLFSFCMPFVSLYLQLLFFSLFFLSFCPQTFSAYVCSRPAVKTKVYQQTGQDEMVIC